MGQGVAEFRFIFRVRVRVRVRHAFQELGFTFIPKPYEHTIQYGAAYRWG